jgi:hypothetical protein
VICKSRNQTNSSNNTIIHFVSYNDMPVNLATQIIFHSSKKDYWPSVAQDRIASLTKINLHSVIVNDRC